MSHPVLPERTASPGNEIHQHSEYSHPTTAYWHLIQLQWPLRVSLLAHNIQSIYLWYYECMLSQRASIVQRTNLHSLCIWNGRYFKLTWCAICQFIICLHPCLYVFFLIIPYSCYTSFVDICNTSCKACHFCNGWTPTVCRLSPLVCD